jgi:putative heme-binding domain-containing protein
VTALVLLLFLAAEEVAPGDPAIGRQVYADQSCGLCHKIDGEGVDVGPDLSKAGSRSVAYLKQSIREPNAAIVSGYRAVTVTTAAGATIRGVLKREDEASIELRDLRGRHHTFPKSELRAITRETDSLMPAYVMPATDVDNLIAYLKTKQ